MAPKKNTNTKNTETPVLAETKNQQQVSTNTKKNEKTVAKTPVEVAPSKNEPTQPTPVQTAPVTTPEPVSTTPAPTKKVNGRKATNKNSVVTEQTNVVVPETQTPVEVAPKKRDVKPRVTKPRTPRVQKTETEVTNVEDGEIDNDDSRTRSFKVQLPNQEEFTGRFTGLTPYQAANKALSKYFRSLDTNTDESISVNFSIKESTRGSRRHVYTYKGSRERLVKPITYTIKSAEGEERVITKQYKNKLVKVKKSQPKETALTATA
jgi:hypothetical protein